MIIKFKIFEIFNENDPYGEEDWTVEKNKHNECCPKHGCKYKDKNCPVVKGEFTPKWWISNEYTNPCLFCYGEEWR